MTNNSGKQYAVRIAAGLVMAVVFALTAMAAGVTQAVNSTKEKTVTTRAAGPFDVKLSPLALEDKTEGTMLARMSLDKQFHGDLEAVSKGEMLSAGTSVKSSAGYVAIERVSGTLNGRRGTFVLQHSGTMTRGEPQLTISVVPDSGTGELEGLAGAMTITIADGKHSYEMHYTLGGKP
jgi:hypothetical protein